jgi:hypothetical protein
MTASYLNFKVSNTDPSIPLQLDVKLNNVTHFSGPVTEPVTVSIPVEDVERTHVLSLTMREKTTEHTRVDADNNIVKDVVLDINDINFDHIDIEKIVHVHAKYSHDFNGNGDPVTDQFFGTMGCNGTVELTFTTPFYLWLLENM